MAPAVHCFIEWSQPQHMAPQPVSGELHCDSEIQPRAQFCDTQVTVQLWQQALEPTGPIHREIGMPDDISEVGQESDGANRIRPSTTFPFSAVFATSNFQPPQQQTRPAEPATRQPARRPCGQWAVLRTGG
ncbi:hypothetical protein CISG_02848 [Coccidioides immitis RMSCC 3703]|uniref:Uncharacterized protein n=2 Tax=Coccidioides TaxID=5500 RepID=A0A0J8RAF1_COCIT|nr:hypothetical protein CPAG_02665 [Coccidioides posadasii RMSCC 3488]KMU81831.1 hypothetical protein CISG_02848 [Coccidioides immitis RMSCC 3703]